MQIYEKLKVLIADDLPTVRHAVSSLLKEIGVKDISEADDGLVALLQLKSNKFDVLITDEHMPNLDGISLVRMIRSDPALKDLIVLLITAEAKKEEVVAAIKAGIDDYLVKPFTGEILIKKLDAMLKKNAAKKK